MEGFVSEEQLRSSIDAEGRRHKVQPADVRGRFARVRTLLFPTLIAIYLALPFIQVGGRPAVFFDLPRRQFFLFGQVFNAQDFWIVFFVLSAIGWSLIFVTTLWGRVWCGYACPHTVFLEGVFRRIERLIEGTREARIRLQRAPWTASKIAKKTLKHGLYAVLAAGIAHAFLAYFISWANFVELFRDGPRAHPVTFTWAVAMSAVIYFNFAWFREQLCLVICPYGRLQSVITDQHSIVIGYDTKRGEPRGKVSDPTAGDCVQCGRCVAVCPTGIDIRNGLQLDCIGCSACVDACDDIMDKVGRKRGLVRYDSLAAFEGQKTRWLRPRVLFYALLGVIGLGAASVAAGRYESFEASLIRATSTAYILDAGTVRNAFTLHLVNKRDVARTYRVSVQASPHIAVSPEHTEVHVGPLGASRVTILATAQTAAVAPEALAGTLNVTVLSTQGQSDDRRDLKAPFLAP